LAKSTDVRETPQDFFEAWNTLYNFTLDAAAIKSNRKVKNYLGPDHEDESKRDALNCSWGNPGDAVWLNPPYSRGELEKWLSKCEIECARGITVVVLLPSDTSTKWFHKHIHPRLHMTHFIQRRLKFNGAPLDKKGKLAASKFGSIVTVFLGKLE
jgi:phage N-6-adenine-methyltransferase